MSVLMASLEDIYIKLYREIPALPSKVSDSCSQDSIDKIVKELEFANQELETTNGELRSMLRRHLGTTGDDSVETESSTPTPSKPEILEESHNASTKNVYLGPSDESSILRAAGAKDGIRAKIQATCWKLTAKKGDRTKIEDEHKSTPPLGSVSMLASKADKLGQSAAGDSKANSSQEKEFTVLKFLRSQYNQGWGGMVYVAPCCPVCQARERRCERKAEFNYSTKEKLCSQHINIQPPPEVVVIRDKSEEPVTQKDAPEVKYRKPLSVDVISDQERPTDLENQAKCSIIQSELEENYSTLCHKSLDGYDNRTSQTELGRKKVMPGLAPRLQPEGGSGLTNQNHREGEILHDDIQEDDNSVNHESDSLTYESEVKISGPPPMYQGMGYAPHQHHHCTRHPPDPEAEKSLCQFKENLLKRINKDKVCSKKAYVKGKYTMYTLEEKLQILRFVNRLGEKKVATILGMSIKKIIEWKERGPERKKGAGRKTTSPQLEDKLTDWIINSIQATKTFPTNAACLDKAISLAQDLGLGKNFKASKGWFSKYKIRKQEPLRRAMGEHNIVNPKPSPPIICGIYYPPRQFSMHEMTSQRPPLMASVGPMGDSKRYFSRQEMWESPHGRIAPPPATRSQTHARYGANIGVYGHPPSGGTGRHQNLQPTGKPYHIDMRMSANMFGEAGFPTQYTMPSEPAYRANGRNYPTNRN